MSRRRLARSALAALAAVLPAAAFVRAQVAQEAFPHEEHAGLFPLCAGCHAGVLTGVPGEVFPAPALCVRCHEGVELSRVVWEGHQPRPDNVAFDHAEHARALARANDPDPGCAGCHAASPEERMQVAGRPDPTARCLTCHAHAAQDHLDDAKCSTCHVPLAASGFSRDRILALPKPADHESPAFLAEIHGPAATTQGARCATCHAQERCTSCHVDATPAAIQAVPVAPADMETPSFEARYPRPATHAAPEWLQNHGARASLAACGTCHTRADCTACHQTSFPSAVAALPERAPDRAPGAGTRRHPPESHLTRFFATDHGVAAAAQGSACATCHTSAFCADCHRQAARLETGSVGGPIPPRLAALLRSPPLGVPAGVPGTAARMTTAAQMPTVVPAVRPGPGFHPVNFAVRHAPAAYGQTMECANCHSFEAFCKACHGQVGLTPAGRAGPGFHDAGPVWLLGHGQAARQGLESCASCHRQSDCVQCHSTVGSFRVNPHGASFDAARAWARAPGTCLVCHLGKPL